MKIFFSYVSSKVAKHIPDTSSHLEEIAQYLKSLSHTTDTYSYVITEEWETRRVSDESFGVLQRIQKSDVFIGEMTFPSQTMGFLLAYAVLKGKPCLYLYEENKGGRPWAPLLENPSRLLTIRSYSDEAGYQKAVSQFLRKANKQLRSDRTTFVTTKQINDYLSWKVRSSGLSKGEAIRGILEEAIQDTDSNNE